MDEKEVIIYELLQKNDIFAIADFIKQEGGLTRYISAFSIIRLNMDRLGQYFSDILIDSHNTKDVALFEQSLLIISDLVSIKEFSRSIFNSGFVCLFFRAFGEFLVFINDILKILNVILSSLGRKQIFSFFYDNFHIQLLNKIPFFREFSVQLIITFYIAMRKLSEHCFDGGAEVDFIFNSNSFVEFFNNAIIILENCIELLENEFEEYFMKAITYVFMIYKQFIYEVDLKPLKELVAQRILKRDRLFNTYCNILSMILKCFNNNQIVDLFESMQFNILLSSMNEYDQATIRSVVNLLFRFIELSGMYGIEYMDTIHNHFEEFSFQTRYIIVESYSTVYDLILQNQSSSDVAVSLCNQPLLYDIISFMSADFSDSNSLISKMLSSLFMILFENGNQNLVDEIISKTDLLSILDEISDHSPESLSGLKRIMGC